MIGIGTLVELKVPCLGNPKGTLGVCYQVYDIGHTGYSFIFENGNYDGFSGEQVTRFLQVVGQAQGFDYSFTNVMQLGIDFNNGHFDRRLKTT